MENASKALLMAAGVLIGVVLLSLLAYLFTTYGDTADTIQKQIELGQIQNFNNKFLAYDGQTTLTIYDINTVVNMVADSNKKYGLTEPEDNNYYISVYMGNKQIENDNDFRTIVRNMENKDSQEYIDKKNNSLYGEIGQLKKYTCKVGINSNTQLVNKVQFTET